MGDASPREPVLWPEPAPLAPPGYLDALGGVPPLPSALHAMLAAEQRAWADPARLHHSGRVSDAVLNAARVSWARSLGVSRLYLGSSAASIIAMTVAHLTGARIRVGARPRVVVSAVESYAVLRGAGAVPGVEVFTVPVDSMGRIDREAFAQACTPDTAVVCVQRANAELGTVQPLEALASITRPLGIPLVSDAMACVDRIPLSTTSDLPADVMIAGAHDWGGPAGAAFAAVHPDLEWAPPTAPDRGWMGGFPNVAAAAGAATALEYLHPWWQLEAARHFELINQVRTIIADELSDVTALGDPIDRLPHVLTLLVDGMSGEYLVSSLAAEDIAVASGSACTADAAARSHVVEALGFAAPATVRISLPWNCTNETVERFVDRFIHYVKTER